MTICSKYNIKINITKLAQFIFLLILSSNQIYSQANIRLSNFWSQSGDSLVLATNDTIYIGMKGANIYANNKYNNLYDKVSSEKLSGQLFKKIIFKRGHFLVCNSITFKYPYSLEIENYAQVIINKPDSLNISCVFNAPKNYIFEGEGNVIFSGNYIQHVYPQWWGATGNGRLYSYDNDSTDAVAIQKAILSYPKVFIPSTSGYYFISRTIELKNNTSIFSDGAELRPRIYWYKHGISSRIYWRTPETIFMNSDTVNGNSNILIRDLKINGNYISMIPSNVIVDMNGKESPIFYFKNVRGLSLKNLVLENIGTTQAKASYYLKACQFTILNSHDISLDSINDLNNHGEGIIIEGCSNVKINKFNGVNGAIHTPPIAFVTEDCIKGQKYLKVSNADSLFSGLQISIESNNGNALQLNKIKSVENNTIQLDHPLSNLFYVTKGARIFSSVADYIYDFGTALNIQKCDTVVVDSSTIQNNGYEQWSIINLIGVQVGRIMNSNFINGKVQIGNNTNMTRNVNNIIVENNNIIDSTWDGLVTSGFFDPKHDSFSNIYILNNNIYSKHYGIDLDMGELHTAGSKIFIRDNKVKTIGKETIGIIVRNSDSLTVENNIIDTDTSLNNFAFRIESVSHSLISNNSVSTNQCFFSGIQNTSIDSNQISLAGDRASLFFRGLLNSQISANKIEGGIPIWLQAGNQYINSTIDGNILTQTSASSPYSIFISNDVQLSNLTIKNNDITCTTNNSKGIFARLNDADGLYISNNKVMSLNKNQDNINTTGIDIQLFNKGFVKVENIAISSNSFSNFSLTAISVSGSSNNSIHNVKINSNQVYTKSLNNSNYIKLDKIDGLENVLNKLNPVSN